MNELIVRDLIGEVYIDLSRGVPTYLEALD